VGSEIIMTYEEFKALPPECLVGWVQRTAERDGKPVALILTKNFEIHLVPLVEKGMMMSRKNIIETVTRLLKQHGLVMTRYPIQAQQDELKLVQKLGFKKSWQDQQFSYWALDHLPFQKRVHHD
jgi:hypothetical protein